MGKSRKKALAPDISAEDVHAFLKANPDFLSEHPELLKVLTPPEENRGRGVVDFQQFMLGRLRDEFDRAREQQRQMVVTARANLAAQNRIHRAALALLECRSFEELIERVTTDLALILDVDTCLLLVESNGLEPPHVHKSGVRVVEPGVIGTVLAGREVILAGATPGDPVVFGPMAGVVASSALLRLHVSSQTPEGMLALGSRDPSFFEEGQATELLGFLAQVVERILRMWLDLPE